MPKSSRRKSRKSRPALKKLALLTDQQRRIYERRVETLWLTRIGLIHP